MGVTPERHLRGSDGLGELAGVMSGHKESEAYPTLPLPGRAWIQNQSTPVWHLAGDLAVVVVAKMDVRDGVAGAVHLKYSSEVEGWGMVA